MKKMTKNRSPYGVTGKGFSVIFDDFDWNPKVDMEIPGGALEAEKWLLAGTGSKNNDSRGRPKGAHRGHPEVLGFQQLARP